VGIAPDKAVEITEQDRVSFDLWKRRDSATPGDRARLEKWADPVLAAAVETLTAK
jgi:hypothetical protein